ncbi:unnamed protein product [Closterium sp. Yama58-4]|nr:unnamed protein product [Closterium sp. Yama58-4]
MARNDSAAPKRLLGGTTIIILLALLLHDPTGLRTGTRGAGHYFVAEAIPYIEKSQLPPLKELSKVVRECDKEGFVVSITPASISSQQGFDTIPDVITQLTRLTSLDLGLVPIRGTLPASMGNMTNLQELKINQMESGSIPASFGNMASLQSLTISVSDYDTTGAALTGPIPESISNLKNLTLLDLRNNNIGPLTDTIGTIPNLEYLMLSGNNFTGSTIPSTINALTNLIVLDLDYTGVGGSIPSGLGSLPRLNTLNYDATVACPASNTSCVVEQREGSEFCTACAAFCSSCTPPAPAPVSDAPPSIAEPSIAEPSEASPSQASPSEASPSMPPISPPNPAPPSESSPSLPPPPPPPVVEPPPSNPDGSSTTNINTVNTNNNNANASATAASSSSSGLTTGAIVGIVVGVMLFIVGTIAVVFIVIQCGNRFKEVQVEYTTQPAGAYAGGGQYEKPPQGAYAGYQPGAAGQV